MLHPKALIKGDKIAILSPASIINPDFVKGACKVIESWGFVPVVMPHGCGIVGAYSG